jgi:hypothetical protein
MNTDYNELCCKPFFELPQLRKDVNAVDSPISPEIEEQDLAAKIGYTERATSCMNPIERRRKIRCANYWDA